MVKLKQFPEVSELVVGTVRQVKGFGAFVKLEEYPNKEGFIHITEVTSGWVKYIRDYVKENQRVVCKVIRINKQKSLIDLSLKKVNKHQKIEKIQEWKNEVKAERLFEIVAKKLDRDLNDCYKEFGFKLIKVFGSLFAAFEECVINPNILPEEGFDGEWIEAFQNTAKENIQPPYVDVNNYLELSCNAPDGIEHIKKALLLAEEIEGIDIQYVGAPKYRIHATALDYKTANDSIKKATERAIEYMNCHDGEGSFKGK